MGEWALMGSIERAELAVKMSQVMGISVLRVHVRHGHHESNHVYTIYMDPTNGDK